MCFENQVENYENSWIYHQTPKYELELELNRLREHKYNEEAAQDKLLAQINR